MRCDQHVGFPGKALAFLNEFEIPEEVCEHCGSIICRKLEQIGEYYGMFENTYPLFRHQLKDGRYADEFYQCAPWSSGPVIFLGLKVSDGTIFEWSEDEIEENL
ncbi:MAG: hypothetical protein ACFFG0_08235 [Candidatus Thorarchaeota archaeon]